MTDQQAFQSLNRMNRTMAQQIIRALCFAQANTDCANNEREAKKARMLERAGVGKRYFTATTPNAKELADTIEETGSNLYIHGNVGGGKTYLACAIINELIFHHTCQFAFFTTLINDLMRYHDKTAGNLIRKCKTTDILVIDDIGKENINDFVLSQLFEVFNERNANLRPTIMTSNYSISELFNRLARKGNTETAHAIISRISDNVRIIKVDHHDRRIGTISDNKNRQLNTTH